VKREPQRPVSPRGKGAQRVDLWNLMIDGVAIIQNHGMLRACFSIMEQPKIVAYLKPSCGWSNGVRAVLKKYGLDYEDRDIINRPEYRAEMIERSGQMLSPCVEVNGQMLADVSGEEVEAWLLANQIVRPTDQPADAPTNQPCPGEGSQSVGFRPWR
jgi:monothiol glutaredoxin